MNKKHVFLGKVVRKIYEVEAKWDCKPNMAERYQTVKREKVSEMEYDSNFLKGDEIYLKEVEKYATIEKCTKSTDGSMIYNVTYIIDSIEDKETEKSLEKAKKRFRN